MKQRSLHALILAGVCAAALIVAARASDEEPQALSKEQLAQFDKGATSIDVAAYPPGLQQNYTVFRQKCSLCHTLSRPINCVFALPDEWSR